MARAAPGHSTPTLCMPEPVCYPSTAGIGACGEGTAWPGSPGVVWGFPAAGMWEFLQHGQGQHPQLSQGSRIPCDTRNLSPPSSHPRGAGKATSKPRCGDPEPGFWEAWPPWRAEWLGEGLDRVRIVPLEKFWDILWDCSHQRWISLWSIS